MSNVNEYADFRNLIATATFSFLHAFRFRGESLSQTDGQMHAYGYARPV